MLRISSILLYNEAYHVASPEFAVWAELCHEVLRLAAIRLEHPLGATPASHALAASMSLNAARRPRRLDSCGNLNSLFDQDRSLWDRRLIQERLRLPQIQVDGRDCFRTIQARKTVGSLKSV